MKIYGSALILLLCVIANSVQALTLTPEAEQLKGEIVAYLRNDMPLTATDLDSLRTKCSTITNTNNYSTLSSRDASDFKSNCENAILILEKKADSHTTEAISTTNKDLLGSF